MVLLTSIARQSQDNDLLESEKSKWWTLILNESVVYIGHSVQTFGRDLAKEKSDLKRYRHLKIRNLKRW